MLSRFLSKASGKMRLAIARSCSPAVLFHSDDYLRHNARRLEHLASLRIPVAGMTVLEIGAGIGDHSHYYIDRGCDITITEARKVNLRYLRRHYPSQRIAYLDMENPVPLSEGPYDIVHCYGILYHLSNPRAALEFMSRSTGRLLFLETCVSCGKEALVRTVGESRRNPTQAKSGVGSRPTRRWIYEQLKRLFEFVYVPSTQPNHEEFPLDWRTTTHNDAPLQRAVFVAARERVDNDLLVSELIPRQTRHE
jgi:hypothetical protein